MLVHKAVLELNDKVDNLKKKLRNLQEKNKNK